MKTKTLLKKLLTAMLAVSFALTTFAAEKKPNIVHIVADDLGWEDVGFMVTDEGLGEADSVTSCH